jgi:hypothetical protein
MRAIALVGAALIVAGILVLGVRVFSYTTQENVLDIGPIHATADKEHNIFVSPIVGIVAIIAGGALVFAGLRRT